MLLKTFKMHKKGVHDVFAFGVVEKYVVCMIKQDKKKYGSQSTNFIFFVLWSKV